MFVFVVSSLLSFISVIEASKFLMSMFSVFGKRLLLLCGLFMCMFELLVLLSVLISCFCRLFCIVFKCFGYVFILCLMISYVLFKLIMCNTFSVFVRCLFFWLLL